MKKYSKHIVLTIFSIITIWAFLTNVRSFGDRDEVLKRVLYSLKNGQKENLSVFCSEDCLKNIESISENSGFEYTNIYKKYRLKKGSSSWNYWKIWVSELKNHENVKWKSFYGEKFYPDLGDPSMRLIFEKKHWYSARGWAWGWRLVSISIVAQ